jgi:hypothetical protein
MSNPPENTSIAAMSSRAGVVSLIMTRSITVRFIGRENNQRKCRRRAVPSGTNTYEGTNKPMLAFALGGEPAGRPGCWLAQATFLATFLALVAATGRQQ